MYMYVYSLNFICNICMLYAGVLLPGQSLAFPFFFKSPNAGVFSEAWSLQTGPLLAGGRPVRLTLKGVAVQEDINAHKREELEVNHMTIAL